MVVVVNSIKPKANTNNNSATLFKWVSPHSCIVPTIHAKEGLPFSKLVRRNMLAGRPSSPGQSPSFAAAILLPGGEASPPTGHDNHTSRAAVEIDLKLDLSMPTASYGN